jgi:hypothetical protein
MTRKLTTSSAKPMSDEETKMMWSLHGSIFYIGIRKSVSRRNLDVLADSTRRDPARVSAQGLS